MFAETRGSSPYFSIQQKMIPSILKYSRSNILKGSNIDQDHADFLDLLIKNISGQYFGSNRTFL